MKLDFLRRRFCSGNLKKFFRSYTVKYRYKRACPHCGFYARFCPKWLYKHLFATLFSNNV